MPDFPVGESQAEYFGHVVRQGESPARSQEEINRDLEAAKCAPETPQHNTIKLPAYIHHHLHRSQHQLLDGRTSGVEPVEGKTYKRRIVVGEDTLGDFADSKLKEELLDIVNKRGVIERFLIAVLKKHYGKMEDEYVASELGKIIMESGIKLDECKDTILEDLFPDEGKPIETGRDDIDERLNSI